MDAKVLHRNNSVGIYSAEQQEEIERVIHAFYHYLRDSNTCELVWSDKLGYLFLTLGRKYRGPKETKVIRNADELARALLDSMTRDARSQSRMGRLFHRKQPELIPRAEDYLSQLPEFQNCSAAGTM